MWHDFQHAVDKTSFRDWPEQRQEEGFSKLCQHHWLQWDNKEQEFVLHAFSSPDCPKCGTHYSQTKGGCLHFQCIKCLNEFCGGCGESFADGQVRVFRVCSVALSSASSSQCHFHAQECGRLTSCARKGFHAHHPRDCLFHLRDFSVRELQEFLERHGVPFEVEEFSVGDEEECCPEDDCPGEWNKSL